MAKPSTGTTYRVGYGKTPEATRFRKGLSGNPKGRPKGSKNLETLVDRVFNRKIVAQDNGRTRRISVAEAMLTKLASRGLGGDMGAARLIVNLLERSRGEGEADLRFDANSDRALLRAFLEDNDPEPMAPPTHPRKRSR
jgi:hypothetical protein